MTMVTYISMIRGINVGGKKIKMDKLKELYRFLEFEEINTYIQSGNVIFKSSESDSLKLSRMIENRIFEIFNFDVKVLIRTKNEMKNVINGNPFDQEDHNHIYVTFLSDFPSEKLIDDLNSIVDPDITKSRSEKYYISNKEIYLFLPNGYGRTKLNNNFFEKKLRLYATTRNWRSVNKIVDIAFNKKN
jgi:uncharacterized protein (DUF1697 family)